MGVKGLYSLLANEPSRFGRQWSTDLDTDVDIYIDGPALHHHLIHIFQRRTNLPPSISLKSLDYSSAIVSPCTIYKLTRVFFAQLLEATSKNSRIHLVCDGVASVHKGKQQVERIANNCELFDQATRNFINGRWGTYHVPHLWGEDAMVEAADADACEKLHLHFAPSEAESFIANMIARKSDGKESVVLSNDTDFLVFGVAFVPLQSLEYRSLENYQTILMGWEYTRPQFIAAYPELDEIENEESFIVTTTMAALTGCDYYLPTHLQRRISSARNVIVNSNIGGLRQRHRNDPTAKFTLLAVLRYIVHFRSQNKEDWMKKMIKSIVTSEGETDKLVREHDLMKALESIRSAYQGNDIGQLENGLVINKMVELNRLLLQKKIYCKSVMELCEGAGRGDRPNKRTSKSKGKKKKKGPKDDAHSPNEIHNRIGEGGSMWMSEKFVLCRDQLYSYLAQQYPPFALSVDGCNNIVTEYCRAGGSENVTYKEFQAIIPDHHVGMNSSKGQSFIQDKIRIIAPGLDEENQILLEECVGQLSPMYHYLLYISLLLDSKVDVLFLLAMALIPCRTIHRQKEYQTLSDRKEYVQSLGRLQIAAQHAKLIFDAITCFGGSMGADFERNFSPRKIFCDEHLLASWSIIAELNEHKMDESILGEIKQCVKRTFQTRAYALDEVVDSIWITWLTLNPKTC
jgi:hypothetical protein